MATYDPLSHSIDLELLYEGPGASAEMQELSALAALRRPRGEACVVVAGGAPRERALFELLGLRLCSSGAPLVHLRVWTTGGAAASASLRRCLLRDVDGVVFVAAGGRHGDGENLQALEALEASLEVLGRSFETVALVIQVDEGEGSGEHARWFESARGVQPRSLHGAPAGVARGGVAALRAAVHGALRLAYRRLGLAAHGISEGGLLEGVSQALEKSFATVGSGERVRAPQAPPTVAQSPPQHGCEELPWLEATIALARRVVEVEGACGRAMSRAAELDRVLRMASHDLKKPLTALRNFLHVAGRPDLELLSDRQREALNAARETTEQLEEMIREQIDTQLAPSDQDIERAVDLALLVDDVLSRLRFLAAERGIVIRCRPLPVVRGDPSALASVFMNLIGNALKYSDLSKTMRLVEVGSRVHSSRVLLYVADNGIGIPRGEERNLFRRHRRASNVGDAPGSGLGLSIVREVIERHEGRVRVRSRLGRGSCFVIELPAHRLAGARTRQPIEPRAARHSLR
ncbi:MAG: HAMP domain-containing sensor histidine kinase [Planctomycetota bacterium]